VAGDAVRAGPGGGAARAAGWPPRRRHRARPTAAWRWPRGSSSATPAPRSASSLVRNLHHRNLVQEQGEFASAAEDRQLGAEPVVTPASVDAFLGVVRDAYTLAAAGVGGAAEDLVNWLPGAQLTVRERPKRSNGRDAHPLAADVDRGGPLSGRGMARPTPRDPPAGAVAVGPGSLGLAVRRRPAKGRAAAPAAVTAPGFTRIDDSAAPLLFDAIAMSAWRRPPSLPNRSSAAGLQDGTVRVWRESPAGRWRTPSPRTAVPCSPSRSRNTTALGRSSPPGPTAVLRVTLWTDGNPRARVPHRRHRPARRGRRVGRNGRRRRRLARRRRGRDRSRPPVRRANRHRVGIGAVTRGCARPSDST